MSNKLLFCIFIRGFPGSGKTSLAKIISSVHKTEILNPDNLSLSNEIGNLKTTRLRVLKYRYLLDLCVKLLKDNRNVVWEQPWRKIKNIQITIDSINNSIGRLSSTIKFLVLEISIDKNTSWDRSQSKFKNFKRFEKYINKYEEYNLKIPYLRLDGAKDTEELIYLVTKALKAL